ncbi:DNA-nicking endonuclease, Smr domain [Succinivibrio dextrinosolvens DSM 3072]|uniref:DNA-nicking endonuclease, Smr domain n=1 Tax=Succinivibrio dextrinosolvens DSM 3072 TaxID=1123324 RepID=A0A1T4VSZ7_9GAMM|nr:DNA endonuclease SmrA [Succinivibrio dextrinosolvens]SKA67955.1 DNA-nicking endonuclease, Smr domain [Succinivibrio dextrinosolvens DSM 3072]
MSNKNEFLELLSEEENLTSESFSDLISGDIKPIVQDKIEKTSEVLEKDLAKIRQEAATRKSEDVTDSASSGFVHMVQPNDILEYRKPGVQPYVMQKLRHGEYTEADHIDLHGKTIEQAYHEVMNFIAFAKRHEFRNILIIHGKGERSNPKALMKSHVAHWLKQIPDVLAFHSAPVWKGGTGAVCIILKKGDKASIQNREEFQRR